MVKYCENKYPIGSFEKQRTAGRYMDGYLHDNISLLAKNITKDITYLAVIFSSTYEVGTGKSVFTQHLAEAYLEEVNKYHNLNLDLTINNVVFSPKELITRAFKVPRYSVVIVDEWEDAHYWSELGMTLRQFFRKCRQLNLFIFLIIPNFFQLPMPYAISRSIFAVDVWFSGEFERGYFSFYNFDSKKELYVKGKREMNYRVIKPNFCGRFPDGYAIDEEVYRTTKYNDMLKYDENNEKKINPTEIEINIFKRVFGNIKNVKRMKDCSILDLAKAFGIGKTTAYRWLEGKSEEKEVKEE